MSVEAPIPGKAGAREGHFRRTRARSSLLAQGEPSVWLTGGMLLVALAMILGLIALILWQGGRTFWPRRLIEVQVRAGDGSTITYLGEIIREEDYRPDESELNKLPSPLADKVRQQISENGTTHRRLLRVGNKKLTDKHPTSIWINDYAVAGETTPDWAVTLEREENGNAYGIPVAFLEDGKPTATEPQKVWDRFLEMHPEVRERVLRQVHIRKHDLGKVFAGQKESELHVKSVLRKYGAKSDEYRAALERDAEIRRSAERENAPIQEKLSELARENDRFKLRLKLAPQGEVDVPLATIVRGYTANRLDWWGQLAVYGSRWREFIFDNPREANTEGGVWPAIIGTVTMTLIMTLVVVPFGVLAALYLREYAKSGPIISAVRIAINNLAGVPSIVFGVFGLGFFCYVVGGSIDNLFYGDNPAPTYGTGGLFWASLTLALLTLPVVIVSTEEALSAVPNSMREGSYACGASKWQTIRRIVLPRAMPGIMTGMILAMARGAGEVAPLMLVGAVKIAPELPIDVTDWSGSLGFLPTGPIHAERSFMHLGFHIYDVGFQSLDAEAARPMVYTTAMLLICIIALLNVVAIWLRARLRRKFQGGQF